ncbi:hypothetical protein PROFUN_15105 [Planoprotostelium fungivorum]|uniref:Uncharacterized protein n=1 Tax=Planoprotostelium fungivorum TaxID=1890364 RepID=A0A2P6MZ90_9EUKA|nr:hypothetical protein PROFUN_15105 [Planoprotostelium fungivorum]
MKVKKEQNSIADLISATTLRALSVRPEDYDAAHDGESYELPLNNYYRGMLSESNILVLSKKGHPKDDVILVRVVQFIKADDVSKKLRNSLRRSLGKPTMEVCAVEVVFLFTMPPIRMYGACRIYPKELFKKSIKEHVKRFIDEENERNKASKKDEESKQDKKTVKKEKIVARSA